MPYKGGRTKSTWPKGQKPPVKKPVGAKSAKTKLKESLGLTGWKQLESFLQKEGASKMVEELCKLNGKDFAMVYNTLLEFVKPKQTRQTIVGDSKAPLVGKTTIDLSQLSDQAVDELARLAGQNKPING